MFRKIPVWLIVLAALLVASVIAERVKAAPLMEDADIVRMDGAVATGISRDLFNVLSTTPQALTPSRRLP